MRIRLTKDGTANDLVRALRECAAEPDLPGCLAIALWREEAIAIGDLELTDRIDALGQDQLARLWDQYRRLSLH